MKFNLLLKNIKKLVRFIIYIYFCIMNLSLLLEMRIKNMKYCNVKFSKYLNHREITEI